MLALRSVPLTFAVVLLATAYGISFPVIASRLDAVGVQGVWIGVNTAMPAFGWIAGSMAVAVLQIRFGLSVKRLLLLLAATALIGLVGLRFADDFASMTVSRLMFGGSMGVAIRCVEYWINAASTDGNRGRNLGTYNVIFMLGLLAGSALAPSLGSEGWVAFGPEVVLISIAMVLVGLWRDVPTARFDVPLPPRASLAILRSSPAVFAATLAYGLTESVPTTLLQIYALRNGLDSGASAYALTAVLTGVLLFQFPIASLSDRTGRGVLLLLCALIVAGAAAALPWALSDPKLFLFAAAIFGGALASTYSLALLQLGDLHKSAELVVANSAFGAVYAVGCVVGPLIWGLAADQFGRHGMVSMIALMFGALSAAIALNRGSAVPQLEK